MLSYDFVFALVLLLIVAGAFGSFVYGIEKNTQFERKYLSRDLGLMVLAVESSPGVLEYIYAVSPNAVIRDSSKDGTHSSTTVLINADGNEVAAGQSEYLRGQGLSAKKEVDISNFVFGISDNEIRVVDSPGEIEAVNSIRYYSYSYSTKNFILRQPQKIVFKYDAVGMEVAKDVIS